MLNVKTHLINNLPCLNKLPAKKDVENAILADIDDILTSRLLDEGENMVNGAMWGRQNR
jgi:hypothetical protein